MAEPSLKLINRNELRNVEINAMWRALRKIEMSNNERIRKIANEYNLSFERVRNIVYRKEDIGNV